jgi:hypothetical protein
MKGVVYQSSIEHMIIASATDKKNSATTTA